MTTRSIIDLLRRHPLVADIDAAHLEVVSGCGSAIRFDGACLRAKSPASATG